MRVLVATAVTLFVVMMSGACVANPATTDQLLPESDKEMQLLQFEPEGDDGFDLINVAQNENDLVDPLAKVEAEDSAMFQPTVFASECRHFSKTGVDCTSMVKFTAMAKTYTMTVLVKTYYYSSTNRLLLYLYINGKCVISKYVSAADDRQQTKTVEYAVSGMAFEFSIITSHMYIDAHKGTRSCSRVQIKADNKVWANTARACPVFH